MHTYQCKECNNPLVFVDFVRSPFCEKPNCQRAKVQSFLDENKKNLKQRVTIEVTNACKEYCKSIDNTKQKNNKTNKPVNLISINLNSINSAHLAILPANTEPLVKLTDKRKHTFLTHLKTIYIDLIEQRPPSSKIYTTQLAETLKENENQLLGKACATCKGACCSLGKNHAFQDTVSLRYVLDQQNETFNLEDLIQLYSQYFPKEHYKHACIFQGNLGCTLPRELRSNTCNNYRCESLISYHELLMDNQQKLTIAAATNGSDIREISIFDEGTFLKVKSTK